MTEPASTVDKAAVTQPALTADTPAEPAPEKQPKPPPEPTPTLETSRKKRNALASVTKARRWLFGGAMAISLLGVGVAFSQGVAAPGSKPTSPSKLPQATELADAAPVISNLQDERVSVTLSFTDRSDGKAAFYVVGGPVGLQATTLAEAPRGAQSVRISAVNPEVDYCFVVVAVISVDKVASSVQVCTTRFGTAKP
ncbi:hypothetical protein ACWDV4_18240 [Micromonospora sp. NPDC003197]